MYIHEVVSPHQAVAAVYEELYHQTPLSNRVWSHLHTHTDTNNIENPVTPYSKGSPNNLIEDNLTEYTV